MRHIRSRLVQVARMVLAMVLGIALPFCVQWLDRRRLSAEARARAWNTASWGAAVYAFGPASMLGWMWLTRPRGWRIAYGAVATSLAVLAIALADRALLATMKQPGDALVELLESALVVALAAALLLGILELAVSVKRRTRLRPSVPARVL